MILRFNYGNVNNEYQYQDSKLKIIDECLDENKIRSLFADSYKSCDSKKGRIPLDPVIPYKAHLLYFLRRDIVSFNELPEQINKSDDYYTYPQKLDHELRWILRYNILYLYLKLVEEVYVSKTPKS
jgi:hypothetical protein